MEKLIEDLIQRKQYLEKLIRETESLLEDAPKGKLRITSKDEGAMYYIREKPSDRSGKYVSKAQMPLAEAIAQRDYLSAVKKSATKETTALINLLSAWEETAVEDIYEGLILPRKKLVTPVAVSNEEYARQWLEMPYEKKGFDDSDPEIYTNRGERVRSKSEALLLNAFDSYRVPAKYEVPLVLWNGKTIHPDFDILNVRTREEFRWEHFGKADKPEYMRYNVGRLNDMMLSGWFPGVNLIVTFETENKPLDMRVVHALINKFLL